MGSHLWVFGPDGIQDLMEVGSTKVRLSLKPSEGASTGEALEMLLTYVLQEMRNDMDLLCCCYCLSYHFTSMVVRRSNMWYSCVMKI